MVAPTNAPCYIQRIGTAVPETCLEANESADLLVNACTSQRGMKLLQRITRLTGIQRRYLAGAGLTSRVPSTEAIFLPSSVQPNGPGMAARTDVFDRESRPVVLRAFRDFSRESLERVETLITICCTQAATPGLEQTVLSHTPVPASVNRWNLGFMGCSAGLAGVRLAHHAAELRRECLLVACELASLHFQYTDLLDQMTANVLFGDGAAVISISPRPSGVRVVDCACYSLTEFAEQMIWAAGDHGLRLVLAQELPDTIAAHLPGAMSDFLQRNGLTQRQIRHWAAHPGGPQILNAVESSLALPGEALQLSRDVLREHGNMVSPTIFFVLKRLIDSGAAGPAIAVAFGPGLTIEIVLLELDPNVGGAAAER
ncbi:MAG: 3-oxoacyl-[acyl-carrier-protein] synthase III C-terminal domain-containing protein [Phycisphaerae bacterium]